MSDTFSKPYGFMQKCFYSYTFLSVEPGDKVGFTSKGLTEDQKEFITRSKMNPADFTQVIIEKDGKVVLQTIFDTTQKKDFKFIIYKAHNYKGPEIRIKDSQYIKDVFTDLIGADYR